MSWVMKKTYGIKPKPRCRHSTNYIKGKLYIFGGNDCDMSFNNVYALRIHIYVSPSSLKNDLKNLLHDSNFSDVTFLVEDQ